MICNISFYDHVNKTSRKNFRQMILEIDFIFEFII